nr:putative nuclease HARBI1 isoform X2 [Tanacetum cinerariifolium]
GDTPFCSEERPAEQIDIDETKEKKQSLSASIKALREKEEREKSGDKKYPTIMLEAVASQDLWIWLAFYGIAGANNDINVLDNFSLFDDLLDDLALVVPYGDKRS